MTLRMISCPQYGCRPFILGLAKTQSSGLLYLTCSSHARSLRQIRIKRDGFVAVMSCVLIRLRPEQTVQVSNFCDEKARADLADYRLPAAMSHCLPPTRKISDG